MKPKITLGLYTGNYTMASYGYNLVQMTAALAEAGALNLRAPAMWASSCRVDSNRNRLIYDFLHETESTHLFILDEDMEHPPLMPLILALREKPIITGLYFQRSDTGQFRPHFYRYLGQSDHETRRGHGKATNDDYSPMWQEVLEFLGKCGDLPLLDEPYIIRNADGSLAQSSVMRIDASGFGCVLISREAAEALDEPYLLDQPGLNGDFVFYKQCRQKGIEVWGDASVIASHRHITTLGLRAFDQWTQQLAAEMPSEETLPAVAMSVPNLAAALA